MLARLHGRAPADVLYCRANAVRGAPSLAALERSAPGALARLRDIEQLDARVHTAAARALGERARAAFGGDTGVAAALAAFHAELAQHQAAHCNNSVHELDRESADPNFALSPCLDDAA